MKHLFFALLLFLPVRLSAEEPKAPEVALFGLLGYLSEYISRFDYNTGEPHKDLVESFYPGERELADQFEKDIKVYYKILDRKYTVKKLVGDQGHISFLDARLSKELNSYYSAVKGSGHVPLYTINRAKLLAAPRDARMAYLVSCYRRSGVDDLCTISFSNAASQAESVGELLVQLGSPKVTLRHTETLIPTSFRLDFEYFDALKERLPSLKKGKAINPDLEADLKPWKELPLRKK